MLFWPWSENIKTNDHYVGDAVIGITANPIVALLQFRTEQHDLSWIDAIYINQQDLFERSAQVAVTRQIFGQARHVAIWLGEDTRDGEGRRSLNFLRYIDWEAVTADFWQRHPVVRTFHDLTFDEVKNHMTNRLESLKIETQLSAFNRRQETWEQLTLTDLDQFLTRPWFSRRWVIQELFVCKRATLICGPNSIPVERLMQALNTSDYQCRRARNNVAALL